jgi:hypothetical protein
LDRLQPEGDPGHHNLERKIFCIYSIAETFSPVRIVGLSGFLSIPLRLCYSPGRAHQSIKNSWAKSTTEKAYNVHSLHLLNKKVNA